MIEGWRHEVQLPPRRHWQQEPASSLKIACLRTVNYLQGSNDRIKDIAEL